MFPNGSATILSHKRRTEGIDMEKKTYTAPEMEIAHLDEDVVLLSTVNETGNLDGSAQKWNPDW